MSRSARLFFSIFGAPKRSAPPYAVSAERRRRVIERDGPVCRYCSRVLDDGSITIDHVIPKARGGSNHDDNLVVACRPCNSSKGHREAPNAWVVRR